MKNPKGSPPYSIEDDEFVVDAHGNKVVWRIDIAGYYEKIFTEKEIMQMVCDALNNQKP